MTTDADDTEVAQFIQPKNVLHLTNEQLDWEIAVRQEQRLTAFRLHAEMQAKVRETKNDKLKVQLGKLAVQFEKAIATIDKAIAKAQDVVNKSRAVRLELDDTFDINKQEKI